MGKETASEQSLCVGLGLGSGVRGESDVEAGCRDRSHSPPDLFRAHATTVTFTLIVGII